MIDIIIQGGIWDNTYFTALKYLQLTFTNKVIISTWDYEQEKCSTYAPNDKIEYIFSKPLERD